MLHQGDAETGALPHWSHHRRCAGLDALGRRCQNSTTGSLLCHEHKHRSIVGPRLAMALMCLKRSPVAKDFYRLIYAQKDPAWKFAFLTDCMFA